MNTTKFLLLQTIALNMQQSFCIFREYQLTLQKAIAMSTAKFPHLQAIAMNTAKFPHLQAWH